MKKAFKSEFPSSLFTIIFREKTPNKVIEAYKVFSDWYLENIKFTASKLQINDFIIQNYYRLYMGLEVEYRSPILRERVKIISVGISYKNKYKYSYRYGIRKMVDKSTSFHFANDGIFRNLFLLDDPRNSLSKLKNIDVEHYSWQTFCS
jgi:hypothetical protein